MTDLFRVCIPAEPDHLLIHYLRVNKWHWSAPDALSEFVIPKDGKIIIEIASTGQIRVFRS